MLARGTEVGLAHDLLAVPHEALEPLVGQEVGLGVAGRLDVTQVAQEDEQLLAREGREADHRAVEVAQLARREGVLGEARAERLVGVEAAARVGQPLGRSGEEDAEALGLALQHVVDDREDALVVEVARLAARQLVEVDHLVESDEQAAVARRARETRHELQVLVDRIVVDDRADTERSARLGLRRELRAQPAHGVGLQRVEPLVVAPPVGFDHLREVVAADQLREVREPLVDDLAACPARLLRLGERGRDEALDEPRECAAVRLRARREVVASAPGTAHALARRWLASDGPE